MRPGFDRAPGTMVERHYESRCSVEQGGAERNSAGESGAERHSAERGNTTVSLSRLMRLRKELRCRFGRDRQTMARRELALHGGAKRGDASRRSTVHCSARNWDLHLSDAQLIKPLVLQARKKSDRTWDAKYLSLQNVLLH